jgi:TolA-binding protein
MMKHHKIVLYAVAIIGLLALSDRPISAQYSADNLEAFYNDVYARHDKKLQDFLVRELNQYLQNFSASDHAAEATCLLARVYLDKGKKYPALATFFKMMYFYPDTTQLSECRKQVKDFVTRESAFKNKQEKLFAILNSQLPINTPIERHEAYVAFLVDLDESNLYEFAQTEIQQFISHYPTDSRIDKMIQWNADLYAKMDMPNEASACYLQLGALFPDSPLVPDALHSRGVLLSDKLDNYNDAVQTFADIVTKYPTSEFAGESLFKSGEIKQKELKNYEGAIADYRKLVTDYPQHKLTVNALMAISRIFAQNLKNYPAAIACYEEIVEKYPSSPLGVDALEEIGNIYYNQLKDYSRAAEYYAKISEIHPASDEAPEMLLKAGVVSEEKVPDFPLALEYYQKVIDKYPNHKKADEAAKRKAKLETKMTK